jgi:glycosyltransferase involved in cell wall biosynthesis
MLGLVNLLFCMLVRGFFLPKPDVMVAMTSMPFLPAVAAILARVRGTRLLVWAIDLYPETAIAAGQISEKGVVARIARSVSRWSLRRADRVVTLDDPMRRKLFLLGVEPDFVDVIPLWMQGDVAFDAVGRANMRRTRGWDHKYVVMCAGNHGDYHAMDTMLAAAEALRDDPAIHFCWVGGGSQWPALKDHAARNVSLINYVPREKLAGLLSAADLQVVVMGEGLAGLIHPAKIYNILATRRPFIHIGPEKSPVADVIAKAALGDAAVSFRHGDRVPVAREIRRALAAAGGLERVAGTGSPRENDRGARIDRSLPRDRPRGRRPSRVCRDCGLGSGWHQRGSPISVAADRRAAERAPRAECSRFERSIGTVERITRSCN